MPKLTFLAIFSALSFTLHAQQHVGTTTIQGESDSAIDPASDTLSSNATPEPVFTYVEKMPAYPGGMDKYVKKNLHCSNAVKEADVMLTFTVKPDGTVVDVKIKRGAGSGCDEELIKMLQAMHGWEPGMQNGRKVMVSTFLKLHFEAGKVKVVG